MGLDRLSGIVVVAVMLALPAGCGGHEANGGRRLLDGSAAGTFEPVPGSILTAGRVVRGTVLGARFLSCRPDNVGTDALVIERIGVLGESLTYAEGRTLFACDGGIDPAGEREPPWCGGSAGQLFDGRLLDPRLDVGCRDREGRPLAYAWVEPVADARWIGVDQGPYTEVYEVLGNRPVRVVTRRAIDLSRSRATFAVTQYDEAGVPLVRGDLEAAVAG